MVNLDFIKEEAINQSRKAKYIFSLGAVVFNNDRIISAGYNRIFSKGHNDTQGNCAETLAIRKAPSKLVRGSSILVCRVSKGGLLKMAKPCDRCMKLIQKAGIKKIIYSTSLEEWETIKV